MNGKQLKNSILQWAIQGKLVPQDPNDEPASVLLERIRTEKAKLVKEKKIKKDKNESIIYRGEDNSYYEKFLATGEVKCIDDEIPFEIPNGWEWCGLSLLIYPPKYGTSKKSVPSGILPVLRMGNIQDGEIVFDKLVFSNDLDDNKKLLLQYGDLLFNRTNSAELVGKTAIFRGQRNAIFAGYLILLRPIFINSEYLNLLLNTPYARDYCNEVKTIGVQQCNINAEKISNLLVPIPSLFETVRIVEKVKNIALPIIKYGELYQKLKQLNGELPIILRKSILQEAIQGKLVPQIAEEGTAQELFEQIRQEKLQLVKEGKLKKSALTDSIIFKGDDNKYYERINAQTVEIELPFEYPNNWSVLRLKDICQLIDGEKRNGKSICLDAKYLRGKSSATIVEKGKFVYARDNIILVDGENSGEVFTVLQDGYMGSTFKQLGSVK
ncbi:MULTISPECIES: restriction endonuclease subunit S [Bacteroides]|jgi:type I restriction enzyme S subunit|uniref:restriction endonuclease subunit S n=1 Tax=Bacteroides TaxID=816 RepID=UPI0018970009|nr:restriction endonuclease subunit S [Bacteroides uniformis]MDC1998614.1 restriction endonuclease subunit S [Bacteroides uniformis]MDC2002340.1 restriction endonuclease subunit S [Bacteroides uniformis]MDC2006101.1 restriction endonuclease subunit S [Bacteroides uniformis]